MRKFELDYLPNATAKGDYPGQFTEPIIRTIKSLVDGRVLNLYSGISLIGDIRVDIDNPNATDNCDVDDFIKTDRREWDWVILDPPYQITRTDQKLNSYGIKGAVSANVERRRNIKRYLQNHTENVLWLDHCAPMIKGFWRVKLWLVLQGGFRTVRVLSWLKREMKPLL